jgi:hypothetical protein
MVAALAERFGAIAGLDLDEYETCLRGPEVVQERPTRHLRVV